MTIDDLIERIRKADEILSAAETHFSMTPNVHAPPVMLLYGSRADDLKGKRWAAAMPSEEFDRYTGASYRYLHHTGSGDTAEEALRAVLASILAKTKESRDRYQKEKDKREQATREIEALIP